MSDQYTFHCKYCGEDFGTGVVELALHIGKVHDISRDSSLN